MSNIKTIASGLRKLAIKDNQNRDLDAVKRQMAKEKEIREQGRQRSHKQFEEDQKKYQEAGWEYPDWQTFRGQNVIRVADEPYIAIPNTGKKSAKKFLVVDIRLLETDDPVVTSLKKDELFKWFFETWKSEHGF